MKNFVAGVMVGGALAFGLLGSAVPPSAAQPKVADKPAVRWEYKVAEGRAMQQMFDRATEEGWEYVAHQQTNPYFVIFKRPKE